MEISKSKLDELISAAEKIVEAQDQKDQSTLFGIPSDGERTLADLRKFVDPEFQQNPEKSYDLYYNGIQGFLRSFLPKEESLAKPIRELVAILLTGKEKENILTGRRGGDSRQATTMDMENVISVFSEWAETPHDYMRLSHILLMKNIECGYIPENRTIADYVVD